MLNYSQNIFSQTKTSIDTIYKQDFEDFSLRLVRDDSDTEKTEFRTLYIDKKSGEATKIFVSTLKKDSNWATSKYLGEGVYHIISSKDFIWTTNYLSFILFGDL